MRRLSCKTREGDAYSPQRNHDATEETQVHTPPPAKRARGLFTPLESACSETPSPMPQPVPFKIEFGVASASCKPMTSQASFHEQQTASGQASADNGLLGDGRATSKAKETRPLVDTSARRAADLLNCTFGEALLIAEAAAATAAHESTMDYRSHQATSSACQIPKFGLSQPPVSESSVARSLGLKAVQQSKDVNSLTIRPDGTRIKSNSTQQEQKLVDAVSNRTVLSRAVTRSHSRKTQAKGGLTVSDSVNTVEVRYG